MHTSRHALFAALVLFLAAACSGAPPGSSNGNGDGAGDGGDKNGGEHNGGDRNGDELTLPENPTLEELEAYWAEKSCRVYACLNRTRTVREVCELAREATGFPYDLFRTALASVAAGRAEYLPEAGVLCGEVLTYIDVDFDCFGEFAIGYEERYFKELEALCGNGALLVGTVEHGSACDSNAECVPSADCRRDRRPDCGGECRTRLRVNEPCGGDTWNDCVEAAYCDGSVCAARKYKVNGEMCFDDGECASGKCRSRSGSGLRVCTGQPGREGDECGSFDSSGLDSFADEECVDGLHCRPLPASSGRTGVCEEPRRAGEECWYAQRCKGNQPCAGFFRKRNGGQIMGTCTIRPADVGESCVPVPDDEHSGDTGCYADLICNPKTEQCEEAPAEGEACTMPGRLCGLGMYCDDEGNCRAKKGIGESATGPEECRDDFNSVDGKCEKRIDWSLCGIR